MKLAAAGYLAGAKSRLLPASIPFRFFGAAVVCHVLAWLALLADAGAAPRFAGGLAPPLAALHLMTLGVLAMAAIGASLQLLPVATRQPVVSPRIAAAIFWIYVPGVLGSAAGMAFAWPPIMAAGAVAVAVALVAYAALLARNLAGASAMPAVSRHGRVAMVSLAVVLLTGIALACAYVGVPTIARPTALALHVVFAAYGFMGLLAFGFSYILVPMFALSPAPDETRASVSLGLALIALILGAIAAFGVAPVALRVAAVAAGALSASLHVGLMRTALASGMRRELGRSFRLVKLSWALLGASLVAALGLALELPIDGLATLFGVLLVPGWLVTFLLGILQRIVPFLASMHAASGGARPPTPSSLAPDRPLAIHFGCHLAALALLAAAVLADSAALAAVAALAGLAGSLAFGAFFAVVVRRMSTAAPAATVAG